MSKTTKKRIVNSAIDLFSANGYGETSVRDIAEKVGVKTSSLYYYFESKEAILSYIINIYVEAVNKKKHWEKWGEEKESIIAGKTEVSVDKVMDYLFFKFDEQHDDQYRKIVKIICSEAVRNEEVSNYQRQNIISNFRYIKFMLDTLYEAGKIPKHDTVKLAGILYSIAFAFMYISSIDMNHIDNEYEDTDMFSLLKYMVRIVVEGNYEQQE